MSIPKEFTALTGLFRSSPAFATATYGTVSVPDSPIPRCRYRLGLGKVTVETQSTSNTIEIHPESGTITLAHAGSPPQSRSVVSFLRDELQLPVTIRLLNLGVLVQRGTLTRYANQRYRIVTTGYESLPDVLESATLEICS